MGQSCLPKQFLGFLEEALALRVHVTIARIRKFLQLRPLFGIQLRWNFDRDSHMQIAPPITLHVLHALAFEPEHRAGLCAAWNFNLSSAVERGYFDIYAERRLNKTDWHLANQIVALALENFVLFDMQDHVKISGRSAAYPGFAITGRAQPRSCIDTWRDFQFDLARPLSPSRAAALLARIFDDASRAFTAGTRLRDAENAPRRDD